MKKFTKKQIRIKIKSEDKELIEKVFLLANGMMDLHGYDGDQALERAKDIATTWYTNGKKY